MTERTLRSLRYADATERCSDPETVVQVMRGGDIFGEMKKLKKQKAPRHNSTVSQEPIKPGEGDKSRPQRRVEGEGGGVG